MTLQLCFVVAALAPLVTPSANLRWAASLGPNAEHGFNWDAYLFILYLNLVLEPVLIAVPALRL